MKYSLMQFTSSAAVLVFALVASPLLAEEPLASVAADGPQFHPPETSEIRDFTPRDVPWVEPALLALPSAEELKTVTIRNRTYDIKRISTESPPLAADAAGQPPAVALYENSDQALYFRGAAGAGVKSDERLVIEDCSFILDFEEGEFESWTPRRSAVFVEGYREVVVRNCAFFSKARMTDPLRKVIASVCAYDCVHVQIEGCYFEGRTVGFRGHILAYCCGPTQIRNCEVHGLGRSAGGIWVASGVGEGKIGWSHQDDPSLVIYPPGPLRIENCWVHDQQGKENSDGLYVQSVRPYLIRNCRVENWGDDSLIDVGFRDVGTVGRPVDRQSWRHRRGGAL